MDLSRSDKLAELLEGEFGSKYDVGSRGMDSIDDKNVGLVHFLALDVEGETVVSSIGNKQRTALLRVKELVSYVKGEIVSQK